MKRSQTKTFAERAPRTQKKQRNIKIAPCNNSFSEAMRAACVRRGEPLSNQPLIVDALDSGCWLSRQVAYWPANVEIGHRVFHALQDEDGKHSAFDCSNEIHLILAFMSFHRYEDRLCELLDVSSLEELGVLRYIREGKSEDDHVDRAGLDVRQFRLDVQY